MSKGKRREREAAGLYEQAGYQTYRPQESKYGETDIYGLYDILAIAPGRLPRLVQVSTNRTGRLDFMRAASDHLDCLLIPEYLQVYSGEGWRLMHPARRPEDWGTMVDERDRECLMGEGIVEYLDGS